MSILIGADLVPTKSNSELFKDGNVKELIGAELSEVLKKADCRIFNLEVPLTDDEQPIEKCGPNLIASAKTVDGYKAIGADILTLANNHILDQGERGLRNTVNLLKENDIVYLGAGKDLNEAGRPHIFELNSKKIGIYACAEHEFSIAGDKTAGANPFDPLETPDCVAELKKQCDFVIVLYHGGKEHYRYPSPCLQKNCRKLADKGADLIVCQHSHCVGCEEKYGESTIVYGQGNFLFDGSNNEFWQTSLLIEIDSDFKISYIPLRKQENGVRPAKGKDGENILNDFFARSKEIRNPDFIEESYAGFAKSMLDGYLINMSGLSNNFAFRVINKLSGYKFANFVTSKKYGKKTILALRNCIECEAHRELLTEGLKRKI